jgi:hypothetical protein
MNEEHYADLSPSSSVFPADHRSNAVTSWSIFVGEVHDRPNQQQDIIISLSTWESFLTQRSAGVRESTAKAMILRRTTPSYYDARFCFSSTMRDYYEYKPTG